MWVGVCVGVLGGYGIMGMCWYPRCILGGYRCLLVSWVCVGILGGYRYPRLGMGVCW